MPSITPVVPSPIFGPGKVSHFRITVTNVATTLDALMVAAGAAIPTLTATGAKPTGIYLAVEYGQVNPVFFTWDGYSTPAAALGFTLPLQPAPPAIAPLPPQGYQADLIKLVAPAGNTYVQVKFDWNGAAG